MGKSLRVLIIEDSQADAELLLRELQRGGYEVEYERVETAEAMQLALTQKTWDLILSDHTMPQFNALRALEVLKARDLDLPFILISGTIGEETAVSAMKAGAHDFLVKGKLSRLIPALERELRDAEARRERALALEALRESERQMRALVTSLDDIVFQFDEQGTYLNVWAADESLLAQPRVHLLGKRIIEVLGDQDGRPFADAVRQVVASGHPETIEYPLEVIGGRRWFMARISPILEPDGSYRTASMLIRDITERKQAEEQFYLAVESAPNAIVLVNKDGTISLVNSQAEKFFGYRRADLIGLNVDRLVPERFRAKHAEYREGFLADPQVRSMGIGRDLHALRKEGSEFPVEIGLTPIETREGLLIMATIVDITERKRAEEVLRQSEERFASIFRSSPTPIALTRLADGKTMDVNEAFCKLFGFSREEAVGHTSLELGIVDPEAQTKRVQRVQETGMIRSMEVSARDRSGKPLELLISIETIRLKDETYALTTMIDITERKRAEERNRFLANLVANVSDAIIAVDMQQNIQSWNNGAELLYGWKEPKVLGRPSKDILDTNFLGMTREAVTKQIMEEESWSGEVLQLHRDGTRIPVQSSVALYKDSEGSPAGIVAVNRDITERKQAEQALREKEHLLSEAQRIGHIGSWNYDIVRDTLQYSDEMYRLFDVSKDELRHDSEAFLSLIYSPDRPIVKKWLEDIRVRGQTKDVEFLVFHKNGELRYIRCRGAIEFDMNGKPVRFIGTAQDVTERKLAEIQIRQQVEHLTALRKIDQAISSSFDLNVTLDILLSQVISELHVDAADVLLLDSDGHMLAYAAGQGFRTDAIQSARLRIADSQVARERRLVQVQSLKYKPDVRLLTPLGISEGFDCYFGVPLIVKGKFNGVLEVFHRAPLQPYLEWLDFLNTLAGQAAIAIENATLFENLEHSNRELSQAYDATIEGWSRALDLRDKETEGHTRRVTAMTLKLAEAFGLPEEELLYIRWGALLHDIGKMGVPDHILLKPGELTEEEWVRMKSHPEYAYNLLKPITFLAPALDIPYCHHEKWDGTGYPRGLRGEEIPLVARLFAVVDVWDALRSDRPYRPAWTKEKAKEYIREQAGSQFDPKVVERFMGLIEQ